ncbi:BTAD domain-containing putative transcriptional regulator [Nocardia salmonicida]|uniref:BTAD domain-containing putative transcriptional regulator n=1 Tax=Nocardia salmonicida TaxID=53431 RepID=UPI0033ED0B36
MSDLYFTPTKRRLRAPQARATITDRPRLDALLGWALMHPLILVAAEAGSGKTTLAQAVPAELPRAWYTLSPDDADPAVFIANLASALEGVCPSISQRFAHRRPSPHYTDSSWSELVEQLLAELEAIAGSGLVIVLDDYHHVNTAPINRILDQLVDGLPPGVRILVTTRVRPVLAGLTRWQSTGTACIITRSDLAFTTSEILEFFDTRFGLALAPEQAGLLVRETEGWPIAIGLIGAQLRHLGTEVDALAEKLPDSRDELFAYLGEQVLAGLPSDLKKFLLDTAVPRSFDIQLAQHLSRRDDAARVLERALAAGLFCTADGGGRYRYHHLFRDFLLAHTDDAQVRAGHLRAADHLEHNGETEEALFHAFEAEDHERAARLLLQLGDLWIAMGRHQAFLDATDRLPVGARTASPRLRVRRSRAFRLACDYPAAVAEARAAAAHNATRAEALEAEIDVYLDTVQPSLARPLLAQLRRALDSRQLPKWLALLAEYYVNTGAPELARHTLRRQASMINGAPIRDIRLEVRTGDLHQARRLLDAFDDEALLVHRSHREREPLLAWTHSLLGNREQTEAHARRGIARGQQRGSRSVLFVSTSRLAHSFLCGDDTNAADLAEAVENYHIALSVVAATGVPRLRAESLIGLTVASGRLGNADAVRCHATEALSLLTEAGDTYMSAMAWLAFGIGAAAVAHPDAASHLEEAWDQAHGVGDVYLPALADIWLAHLALGRGDTETFRHHAGRALSTMREFGLDALLVRAPWLGIPDARSRRTWLEQACVTPELAEYARYLISRMPAAPDIGPGPTPTAPTPGLRLQTLGRFGAFRDGEPIPAGSWERRKARELLWLLTSREQRTILREEAVELLWPDADPAATAPRFRVALHALRCAVEPDRKSRGQDRFIHTDDSRITLDPSVELDWTEFRSLVRRALDEDAGQSSVFLGRQAIALYHGSYLEDAMDLPWAEDLRESLKVSFLQVALRTAHAELALGSVSAAAEIAHRVLDADRYRESAYRLLAQVHLASGDTAAAQRTFQTCAALLKADLGITPSWNISDL